MTTGILHSIWIAAKARQPLLPVSETQAIAGKGLEGDRYALGRGSLSRWPGSARQVSLIAQESLQALFQETGIDLLEGRHRRNLVTQSIDLVQLKGRYFRIGDALFRGVGLCQPCAYLERLTVPGAFAGLKGRGGLRAEIITSAHITISAIVELLPESFKLTPRPERSSVREDSNHGSAQSRE